MAAPNLHKRVVTEVTRLGSLADQADLSGEKFILDKSPLDGSSTDTILGRIFPKSNLYNQASYQIEIKLPSDYPFKAPDVRFITPVYHPNVDDKGKICVELLNQGGTYKPVTPLTDIVKAVTNVIDNPDVDHALTPGIMRKHLLNEQHQSYFT